jgi:hypothetical protein
MADVRVVVVTPQRVGPPTIFFVTSQSDTQRTTLRGDGERDRSGKGGHRLVACCTPVECVTHLRLSLHLRHSFFSPPLSSSLALCRDVFSFALFCTLYIHPQYTPPAHIHASSPPHHTTPPHIMMLLLLLVTFAVGCGKRSLWRSVLDLPVGPLSHGAVGTSATHA